MKLYVTFLHVIALLTLTGPTLGDGNNEATSPTICPLKDDGGKDMYVMLYALALSCLDTDGTVGSQFQVDSNLQERKAFFKNYCDKRSQIRECLTRVEEQQQVCLNDQTSRNVAQMFRDLLDTMLDSGCVQDGEVIASMITLIKDSSSSPFKSDPFRDCAMSSIGLYGLFAGRHLDSSSMFFMLYREAINIAECFGNIAQGPLDTSSNMKSIISDITKKMKCFDPQDGTSVRCSTIDITLPDTPRICPIKPLNEEGTLLNDFLTERLSLCFLYNLDGVGFNEIENIDMSRGYLRHACGKKRTIERCWSDVVALSSVCLNATQHNLFTVVEETLRLAYDYGCIEDGQSLAYVVFKVLSDMKKTTTDGHIKECLVLADRVHPEVAPLFDAGRWLIYHQQLNVFKECAINKLHGDNKAVFTTETFLTLVQKSMECLDPEHGTIVLCETIDTTPSAGGAKVCPYVGEKENEQPQYEMFVDLGFMCIKASTLEFDRMDDFTTLKEFQTFFNSFCHNRRAVKLCVDAISSNSAVCQNQTSHQMLSIFTDFLETSLEIGCQQDGGALATIMHGFMKGAESETGESGPFEVCLDTAGSQIKHTGSASDGLSAKSVRVYRAFETLKECVLNGDYEVGLKNAAATFVNDILRSFKCVHPDDGTTVLCETIVNN